MSDRLAALRRDPRWILLPLRAYLGFTFCYAGLSKIGGRTFLDASSPTSMHATVQAVKAQSPIGGLLGPVLSHSFGFGVLIALGELAVGVGVLLGLFTRVAAAGGLLISLSLFLTVSWSASPWYTGADIVYVFALTPLLLGGAGPVALDDWLATVRARDTGPDGTVNDRTRRVVLAGGAALAALLAAGIAGLVRRTGRPAGSGAAAAGTGTTPAPAPAPSGPAAGSSAGSSSSAAPAGAVLVAASKVPVGGAAEATDPKTGDPLYVLQLEAGRFTALDRVCPHAGCPVSFVSKSAGFVCPCHGSQFDASGNVVQGPAASGLAQVPVADQGGQIVRT